MNSASILDSTKKAVGVDPTISVFDTDIIMHINTVFSTLNQLGVGPAEGFAIEDSSATWEEILGFDIRLNSVKSYVYLRVRMLFDPPTTSFLLTALKDQIQELEWRINVQQESETFDPGTIVLDGGTSVGA